MSNWCVYGVMIFIFFFMPIFQINSENTLFQRRVQAKCALRYFLTLNFYYFECDKYRIVMEFQNQERKKVTFSPAVSKSVSSSESPELIKIQTPCLSLSLIQITCAQSSGDPSDLTLWEVRIYPQLHHFHPLTSCKTGFF